MHDRFMGHERKCSSAGTGLSRGITLPYVKYLLLTTHFVPGVTQGSFLGGGYYVMWTTYLEGLLDKKKKNNPQIREKIIIYTKIEAE